MSDSNSFSALQHYSAGLTTAHPPQVRTQQRLDAYRVLVWDVNLETGGSRTDVSNCA